MYLCMCTVFFFFSFSSSGIWRARQGLSDGLTPQDDKAISFFTVPYYLDKRKTRNPFLSVSLHSCTNKQYPPILRFAFISIYIIICISLPHRLRWGSIHQYSGFYKHWGGHSTSSFFFFFFFLLKGGGRGGGRMITF